MEQQSKQYINNNDTALMRYLRKEAVDSAAYHIKYAAGLLRGEELYREDVDIMAAALRELQEVVIQGTERGARAALLKARTQARGSIIQQGEDATADFLRNASKTGGLV
jgi:hypothetical protein